MVLLRLLGMDTVSAAQAEKHSRTMAAS